ncbi:flagellar hook assembly protein FlgD [Robbsia andropogonis]|uniref:flagellar hook assembly protein FlgD n=1 Tax=Robbsia andropogonis TaxID=28092 RepID=UPI0004BAED99|nr:flagellar hook assembly protein FlgD [Robbsia andropogonis]MCP1118752.1 flagellar hook assembly protein FlgD [Robbsia andropogonis]MCP1128219.1 flagellar hook assembly protein FlgD [Robbsia andropogonis]
MNTISNAASAATNGGLSPQVLDAVNGAGRRAPGEGGAAPVATGGATATSAEGKALGAGKTGEDLQNTFMRLLVTEMKNQDPTNPMDSSQMTSQLAQINTVSGIAGLNATMTSLAKQLNAGQQVQASNLIGKSVIANGHDIALEKGKASAFGVNLDAAAKDVQVKISDETGKVVRSMKVSGEQSGVNTLSWDGKNDQGIALPDGKYSFKVSATNGDDPVSAQALSQAKVESVIAQPNGSAGLKLNNGGTTSLSSVSQIL